MTFTIKPLFLLALGLHGLLLLLPMGGASDSVEALPTSEQPKQPPDPSVMENTALSATKPPSPNQNAAASPGIIRPVPATINPINSPTTSPTNPVMTVRPAATARPVAAASQLASQPQPASQSATQLLTSQPADIPNLAAPRPAQNSPSPAQTNPVAVASPAIPAATPARSPAPVPNSQNEQPVSVTTLIASASGKVSDSLRSLSAFFSDGLRYSAEDTDDASASQQRAAWTADMRAEGIETVELSMSDPIHLRYPIEALTKAGRSLNRCLDPAPHHAEIGVLFDAQGNLIEPPALIRSSGYRALDSEISAAITRYDNFPDDRPSKAYTFEVAVAYDAAACVSLEALRQ